MPDDLREGSKKQLADQAARIEALETTVKALLEFAKSTEGYTGEELMPIGDYHGVKFE